ncbi:hypothetical protein E2320_016732 [Naja naja]|nr:hypothetical protein E2320_016732 [Naja naja]
MRWFLKETMVEALSIADCSKHWPNTTEGRNICSKKILQNSQLASGQSLICHDPFTWEWEVMGLVSQSLHNCTIPILASQLLSHIQWLKQMGALENSLQPEDKLPSAAGQQQPVTLLGPVQIPSATLRACNTSSCKTNISTAIIRSSHNSLTTSRASNHNSNP